MVRNDIARRAHQHRHGNGLFAIAGRYRPSRWRHHAKRVGSSLCDIGIDLRERGVEIGIAADIGAYRFGAARRGQQLHRDVDEHPVAQIIGPAVVHVAEHERGNVHRAAIGAAPVPQLVIAAFLPLRRQGQRQHANRQREKSPGPRLHHFACLCLLYGISARPIRPEGCRTCPPGSTWCGTCLCLKRSGRPAAIRVKK